MRGKKAQRRGQQISKTAIKKRWIFQKTHIVLVGIFFLFIVGTFALIHASNNLRGNKVLEIPKNEMQKIPPDVKKTLAKVTPSLLANVRVPILMYHYVEYVRDKGDKIRQSLDVTPNVFDSQVQTLKDAGYTFMTAGELGDVLDGKTTLPPNPILITFDDGHWDLDTDALPILEKYNVKATAYIVSGFIGTNTDSLTPTELQDVINSGLVEIGDHTINHMALKGAPISQVVTQIVQSKQDLEKTYHLHIASFAYPYGSFDQQAIDAVKSAGYTTAVSTIPGIVQSQENRYFLYRLRPGYRTGQDLLNYLQQNTFQAY